jgi:hypothetical protein
LEQSIEPARPPQRLRLAVEGELRGARPALHAQRQRRHVGAVRTQQRQRAAGLHIERQFERAPASLDARPIAGVGRGAAVLAADVDRQRGVERSIRDANVAVAQRHQIDLRHVVVAALGSRVATPEAPARASLRIAHHVGIERLCRQLAQAQGRIALAPTPEIAPTPGQPQVAAVDQVRQIQPLRRCDAQPPHLGRRLPD